MYLDETDDLFFTRDGTDRSAVLRRAESALAGYDDGELFLEYCRAESLVWDDGRLRAATFDTARGFGLRVVSGESVGFAHGNEISEQALAGAHARLESVREDGTHGASGTNTGTAAGTQSAGRNRALYPSDDPTAALGFLEKRRLVERIDTWIRAHDARVRQVTVSLGDSWQAIQIVRLGEARAADIRPLVRLSVSVVLEQNGRRETGSYGYGGRGILTDFTDEAQWRHCAETAVAQAAVNLEAAPAPAGSFPVVLHSGWPGILLHEAIGHGLEGDFNRKGLSAFSNLMGERIAGAGVTVVDDGTLAGRRGSLSIDDEGTASERTVLVEDGILVGYMQDRLNARLTGTRSTGNGRRESYACLPMVRMTNTYMLAGDTEPADLISRVADGIYAVSFGGGQVNITNGDFTFSCTEAYRIRNGKVAEPVKGATLIGNGPKALLKISAIGNDFALDPGVGTCGKDGQSVPVGVGQPSLLLDEMTVGGTA